jgi:hypothetical protein
MTAMRLSAIDHVLAGEAIPPIQMVLRYREALDVECMESAFRATAREFAGLSATLVRVDDHTYALDLASDAAEILIGEAGDETPLTRCIDPVQTRVGVPLARARITRLSPSGGTAVGLAMSHAVADGYGFFLFLAAWAARVRGQAFPAPNTDRGLLSRSLERPPARTFGPGRLEQSGFYMLAEGARPRQLTWHERSIAASELEPPPGDARLSVNDYASALLWKDCLGQATCSTTALACSVDLRRHRPELGPLYFGNALLLASVTMATDALRSADVTEIAGAIREAVEAVPARVDAALVELEELRTAGGLHALANLRSFEPEGGFLISNLVRMPLDALDFGAGPATALDVATPPPRGRTCVLLPGKERLRMLIAQP